MRDDSTTFTDAPVPRPTAPVDPSAPVYRWILEPLLLRLSLPSWEGVTWGDLSLQAVTGAAAIARLLPGHATPLVAAVFFRPTAQSTTEDRDCWAALEAWRSWARAVAESPAIPKTWPLFSTYPGHDYVVPRQWIDDARNRQITWEQWRLYAEAGRRLTLPYGPDTIECGHETELRRGREFVEQLARGVQPSVNATSFVPRTELPAEWDRAIAVLTAELAPTTRRTYRSQVRRVYLDAGRDLEACRALATSLGPGYRSVWSQFERILTGNAPGAGRHAVRLRPHGRAGIFDAAERKAAQMRARQK